ncbi:MAG: NADH-quinone oxidoreductase subunit J [Campylobacteraceae bacterium]|nr:NADH-quinone oxidoreductase subunit J [Campylobacteraceae bacterium]
MIEIIGFYFFAIISLFLFCVSVFSTKTLYAMSALAGGMVFISGFFFLLGAEFLGVIQILVYVGAVVVLYSFSMMFFDAQVEVREGDIKSQKTIYTLSLLSAFLILFMVLAPITSSKLVPDYPIVKGAGNTDSLGIVVFTKYIVVFELAALMLLAGMICAIVLVHKDMNKEGDVL